LKCEEEEFSINLTLGDRQMRFARQLIFSFNEEIFPKQFDRSERYAKFNSEKKGIIIILIHNKKISFEILYSSRKIFFS